MASESKELRQIRTLADDIRKYASRVASTLSQFRHIGLLAGAKQDAEWIAATAGNIVSALDRISDQAE